LYDLYCIKKMSTTDIGKIYGKTPSTIRHNLIRVGIEPRNIKESLRTKRVQNKLNKSNSGKNNPMWDGGTKVLKGGYIGI